MECTRDWDNLGGHVTYEYMFAISLYRVIGRIRMMTLHLGVVNGGSDMVERAWGHVPDMMAMLR